MMRSHPRPREVVAARRPIALIRIWALVACLVAAAPSWVAAQPSTTNVYPLDGAANVSPSPTLEIDCSAPGVVAARYQISTDLAFPLPLAYDSGESTSDICSHVAAVNLASLTTYHWRGAVKDAQGVWSDFSAPTMFTTANAADVHTNMFQDGLLAYSGTRDADIRGRFSDPTQPPFREWNQGAQDVLRTGRVPVEAIDDEIYRNLLKFELARHLTNPDAVINAYLELTGWQHGDPFLFSAPQDLYEVRRSWGEGRQYSSSPPQPGEVSWTYSEFPTAWAVRGAGLASDTDPNADRAAARLVRLVPTNQVGQVTRWSSKAFVDLVKRWIDQPETNHGLLMRGDETFPHVMNFASRELIDPDFRPMLVIESTEQAARPPEPRDDIAGTVQDTAVDIAVLVNDLDPEPGPSPLAISGVGAPANGSAQIVGTEIRYTPAPGFVGADAFSYTVSDGDETGTAMVAVSVGSTANGVRVFLEAENGVVSAPMVVDQTIPDASRTRYVGSPNGAGNVNDPDLAGGQAVYAFNVPDGTYVVWGRVLAPDTNDDTFWVSMDGGQFTRWTLSTSSAWVWDQVNGENVGDPLTFSLVGGGPHSLVIKQAEDGPRLDALIITSNLSFVPVGIGGTANQPPVAVNNTATAVINTPVDIAVLANDSDPDNGPSPLTIQSVGTPASGTAAIVGNIVRYTPNAGFSGPDSFTYTIFDGGNTASATVNVTVVNGIILDNAPAGVQDASRTFTGAWCNSASAGFFGTNSLFSCSGGADTYRWTPTIPSAGSYEVFAWWTAHSNRSTSVPITVVHAGGSTTQNFNQRINGGQWRSLGIFSFNAGTGGHVQVSNANGQASADAARWVSVGAPPADTTPPETTITGGPTGTIQSSTASLTWSGSDDVTPVGSLEYAYRLTPLESSFSAFGAGTSTSYSSLPNGSYTFEVKARDQASNEDATPATRSFTVEVSAGGSEIILDNAPAGVQDATRTFTGAWCNSASSGFFGTNSLFSCSGGADTYRWTPDIPSGGSYEVFAWWTQHANRSTSVPITVVHAGGSTTQNVNQRINGGQWRSLGIFSFNAGTGGHVQVSNANGQASADAARWVPVGAPPADTTPPATTITGGPTGTIQTATASFTWSGSDDVTPVGSLEYAFRLTPLEANFSAFGAATSTSYSSLPNGSYTFEVKARDQASNEDATPATRSFMVDVSAGGEIILDNAPAGVQDASRTFTGAWCNSASAGFFGTESLFSCGGGADTYQWTPTISSGGLYTVFAWWTAHSNRSTSVPITVVHADGSTTQNFNQRVNGGQWISLGTFSFNPGGAGHVQVSDANGQAAADAVRWVPAGPDVTPPETTITGGPTGTIQSTTAAMTWSGSDNATATASLVYAYRLEPLESEFSPFGTETSKSYTNLPNGSYTFHVKARDEVSNEDATPATRSFTVNAAVGEIVLDNAPAGVEDSARTFTGAWCPSASAGFFGTNSLFSCSGGADTYRWTPEIPSAGSYTVFVWWTAHSNRSTSVPITVTHAGGSNTQFFNQRLNGGQWIALGTFFFDAGSAGHVEVSNANGQAAADAVRWVAAP